MNFLKIFLIPFEYLYFLITSCRNWCFDKGIFKEYKFNDKKIISIGNVSVGGSGKTPLVMYLVEKLRKQGLKIGVVTRGYKSNVKEKAYVIKDDDVPSFVGDEPYMIYKNTNATVCISKKRKDGILKIKDSVDVILLDDAMQHRNVARDINILCIDVGTKKARADFLQNRLLPFGFLREKREQVLKRTNIAVLNYRSQYKENLSDVLKIKEILKDIPTFECFVDDFEIYDENYKKEEIKKDIIAFCAISKPQNFFDTLENRGFSIKEKYTYLDHKNINDEELEKIFLKAKEKNLDCVCTEKDFVKLKSVWKKQCYFAKINVKFKGETEFLSYFI